MNDEIQKRDEFQYKDRARQLNSFQGMLLPRNGTPTDIDGYIEYNGKLFINFEGKYKGTEMKYGQRLSFEHLIQSHKRAKDLAIVICYEHEVPTNQDVIVKDQMVSKVYDTRHLQWREPKRPITVGEAVNEIINYAIRNKIINL